MELLVIQKEGYSCDSSGNAVRWLEMKDLVINNVRSDPQCWHSQLKVGNCDVGPVSDVISDLPMLVHPKDDKNIQVCTRISISDSIKISSYTINLPLNAVARGWACVAHNSNNGM